MAKKKLSFEDTVNRLEEVVSLLESPGTPLSRSVELYKEGVTLVMGLSESLNTVEKEVMLLQSKADGVFVLKPFAGKEADI